MTDAAQSQCTGDELPDLVGEAPAFLEAVALCRRFAPSDLPILIVGATGTGKDLLAQHIHRWSGRQGPFVDVNCAAVPEPLAESLFFGHRRGSFSGAVEGTVGLLEYADGGTLFLDELCSLAPWVQPKLLRAIERGAVCRVGDTVPRRTRFGLLCAAQEPLDARVAEGTFRRDLLQRLAGVVVSLPGLAARGPDLAILARRFAADAGRALTPEAVCCLARHSWPGNVRELLGVVQRARWLTHDVVISEEVVTRAMALGGESGTSTSPTSQAEHDSRVLATCEAHGWDAERAAQTLGMHRTTLYRQLNAMGISLRARKEWGSPRDLLGVST